MQTLDALVVASTLHAVKMANRCVGSDFNSRLVYAALTRVARMQRCKLFNAKAGVEH